MQTQWHVPFNVCLRLRAVSLFLHSRVAICVSRVLLDGLQKKERLLVVYVCLRVPINCLVVELDHYNNNSYER